MIPIHFAYATETIDNRAEGDWFRPHCAKGQSSVTRFILIDNRVE